MLWNLPAVCALLCRSPVARRTKAICLVSTVYICHWDPHDSCPVIGVLGTKWTEHKTHYSSLVQRSRVTAWRLTFIGPYAFMAWYCGKSGLRLQRALKNYVFWDIMSCSSGKIKCQEIEVSITGIRSSNSATYVFVVICSFRQIFCSSMLDAVKHR